ncbi:MAG: hypothetical protein Q8O37_12555 [Sulfuricellaceae bacterium]|nr:hypothetical protein [Sulfuricellaceae bacterium]
MTPEAFIAHWANNPLTERAGAQQHFNDLCDLLGVDKPRDPENYCFERGAKKSGGGDGWADVWKRGHFGWENKKPGRDLNAALKQLTDYALQLDSPPLLVVCDRERIIIHTAFTGYPDQAREICIAELTDPSKLQTLRWVFTEPEKLRPEKSTAAITAEAAGQFSSLAKAMRTRGLDGQRVAHFLVQCLFCMFAEDEALLPGNVFTEILKNAGTDTDRAARRIAKIFTAMQQKIGGEYGDHDIAWFNGGLFSAIDVPELAESDLDILYHAAADMDWRGIDPTIFGTLFERGLDPAARAPLGAHYTDTATIAKLITPLITEPLLAEWEIVKAVISKQSPLSTAPSPFGGGLGRGSAVGNSKKSRATWQGFLLRLNQFKVLDPACGSGNFLYLALKALRDVEKQVSLEAQELGLPAEIAMQTGPHNILGIEINEFAAELARVTVWIGDIQWCRRNGLEISRNPILKSLEGIEHRDAILEFSAVSDQPLASEAEWPVCDVIVGNPPFLGDKKMRGELGDDYVNRLRKLYQGRVPGGADLVTYWFEKSRAHIEQGKAASAGLVATNSIRGGANRKVLDRILATHPHPNPPLDGEGATHLPLHGGGGEGDGGKLVIFEAWSDEEWINQGAAVRVSLVCFGNVGAAPRRDAAGENRAEGGAPTKGASLDGQSVAAIHADLTATPLNHAGGGMDLTQARPLKENKGVAFIGGMKKGQFDVSGVQAREWLRSGGNPNGRPNSDVVLPWRNGLDVTRRPSDSWIVDFGLNMPEVEASLYEAPFQQVLEHVKPARDEVNNLLERSRWWLHARPAPDLREATKNLPRFIATPRVAKYRLFDWLRPPVICDGQLVIIARSDDTTFGILHSRFHELWSLRLGTSLEDRPRYTPTTTFETFPFPAGLTPSSPSPLGGGVGEGVSLGEEESCAAENIAQAAKALNQLRETWLNPPEWVDWVRTPEEEKAGYPLRPVAKPGHEVELKKRTLTNLYNARPAWLDNAHKTLDAAVALAYGWEDYTPDMPDEEILRRLLALNLAR